MLAELYDRAMHPMMEVRIDDDVRELMLDGYKTHKQWSPIIAQLQNPDLEAKVPFGLDEQGVLYPKEYNGRKRLCVPTTLPSP